MAAAIGAQKFFTVLFLLPIVMLVGLVCLKMMFEGDIPWWAGLLAMGSVFALVAIASLSNSLLVTGIIALVLITLTVLFPFAIERVAQAEMAKIDRDALDRAYQVYRDRPESPAARIAVAMALHDVGLRGHAAVVIEKTLSGVSSELDPTTNASIRDFFRREEWAARRWRQECDAEDFRPIPCPHCSTPNEPGLLQCKECGRFHLLDLAHRVFDRPRVVAKLIVAWALIALFLGGAVAAGMSLEGLAKIGAILAGLSATGVILAWLLRPARLRA